MTSNMGKIDRLVRIIVGLVLLGVGYQQKNWWGLLGLVPLLTGFFCFCPLYTVLGWNTKPKDETPPSGAK